VNANLSRHCFNSAISKLQLSNTREGYAKHVQRGLISWNEKETCPRALFRSKPELSSYAVCVVRGAVRLGECDLEVTDSLS
jgi:hypothetical protein